MKVYPNSVANLEAKGFRLVVRGPMEYGQGEGGTRVNILPACRRYAFKRDERFRWRRCKTAEAMAALRSV